MAYWANLGPIGGSGFVAGAPALLPRARDAAGAVAPRSSGLAPIGGDGWARPNGARPAAPPQVAVAAPAAASPPVFVAQHAAAPPRAPLAGAPAVGAAVGAALAARATLHETRDAVASLRAAGVDAAWAGLSGAEVAEALRMLTMHIGRHGRDPVFDRYEAYCTAHGLVPVPLTRESVGAYFADYVLHRLLKSSSLPKLLSGLRCYARLHNAEIWLSTVEEELVNRDITTLQKLAPATHEATVELSRDQMLAGVRAARAAASPQGRLAEALLTVLPGLQARGNEVFGLGTLTFEDVVFDENGLCVGQYLGKTAQTVVRLRPKVALHVPAELAELCASRALLAHLSADSDWTPAWQQDPVRKKWPVFSVLKRCGATGRWTCSSTALSSHAAMDIIRDALGRAGVLPAGLDVHFGRPSGSDLYEFELRVAPEMVEALGGWAPTTTLSKFYQRHTARRLAELAMTMVRERYPAGFRACCDP
jgi:hypothetical protein